MFRDQPSSIKDDVCPFVWITACFGDNPSIQKETYLLRRNFFKSSLIWLANIRREGSIIKCVLISINMPTFVALCCAIWMGVGKPSYCSFGHPSLPGRVLFHPLLPTHCLIIEMGKHPHATINSEFFSRCWKVGIKMSIRALLSFQMFMWREGRTDLQVWVSQNKQWHKNEWSMKLNFRTCAVFPTAAIVR